MNQKLRTTGLEALIKNSGKTVTGTMKDVKCDLPNPEFGIPSNPQDALQYLQSILSDDD
jgi:hypothetical protein